MGEAADTQSMSTIGRITLLTGDSGYAALGEYGIADDCPLVLSLVSGRRSEARKSGLRAGKVLPYNLLKRIHAHDI